MNIKLGSNAFLVGFVIAILAGIAQGAGMLTADLIGLVGLVLVILGIVVGVLNIEPKEAVSFLLASVALILTRNAGFNLLPFGNFLQAIVDNVAVFVAPAALIVAIMAIHALAKD